MTDNVRPGGTERPHLLIPTAPRSEPYRRRGSGGPRTHLYGVGDRRAHAANLRHGLEVALAASRAQATSWPEELRPFGLILSVEGWPGDFALALDRLDLKNWGVELLAVLPAKAPNPESAAVFVPYERVDLFFRRFDAYATELNRWGNPKNQALAANIRQLSLAALPQLWTDESPFPDDQAPVWWELWLRRTGDELDLLRRLAEEHNWVIASRYVGFVGRTVAAVRAPAVQLATSLGSRLPIAEIRSPRLVQSPTELSPEVQVEWVASLVDRVRPAPASAPAVCLLDTGIYHHTLFRGSLAREDVHHVVGLDGVDRDGHGTMLGGLALFGDLTDSLTAPTEIRLTHRLESVKFLPDQGDNPSETYATVTAAAAAAPEIANPRRRRVYSIACSAPDNHQGGAPTSWSATIDALAFGTDIAIQPSGLELLTDPNPQASRLLIVAAGNVRDGYGLDYLPICDASSVEDPGQAWNALTVGAYTDLVDVPGGPGYAGYRPIAAQGDLSPFSRTSLGFDGKWPIKPDVLLEGGNIIASRRGTNVEWPNSVSLTTTSIDEFKGEPLAAVNATSAATAQAARLAAAASAKYPLLWPETLRGLLVHAAEWTEPMVAAFDAAPSTSQRRRLVRRYGFGVPTMDRVLASASSAVTIISQSTIRPFVRVRNETHLREMNFHELPWPKAELETLGETLIRLRVTLSYFVEPNPSSRGWRGRYAYPSHMLRFDLKRPLESTEAFQLRMNDLAQVEEGGGDPGHGTEIAWVFGPQARNVGSLHSDEWTGTARDLADCGLVGVCPVGGWWKQNNRHERTDIPVRYSLILSLRAPEIGIDLWTPIANQIGIQIPIEGW